MKFETVKELSKDQKKAKALLFREKEKTQAEEPNCCGQEEPTNHLYSICKWQAARFQIIQRVKSQLHPSINVVTDSGYQGLQKIPSKTQMPRKRSKKSPLIQEDKKNNRQLSRERVLNENVIGSLKRFKIIEDTILDAAPLSQKNSPSPFARMRVLALPQR